MKKIQIFNVFALALMVFTVPVSVNAQLDDKTNAKKIESLAPVSSAAPVSSKDKSVITKASDDNAKSKIINLTAIISSFKTETSLASQNKLPKQPDTSSKNLDKPTSSSVTTKPETTKALAIESTQQSIPEKDKPEISKASEGNTKSEIITPATIVPSNKPETSSASQNKLPKQPDITSNDLDKPTSSSVTTKPETTKALAIESIKQSIPEKGKPVSAMLADAILKPVALDTSNTTPLKAPKVSFFEPSNSNFAALIKTSSMLPVQINVDTQVLRTIIQQDQPQIRAQEAGIGTKLSAQDINPQEKGSASNLLVRANSLATSDSESLKSVFASNIIPQDIAIPAIVDDAFLYILSYVLPSNNYYQESKLSPAITNVLYSAALMLFALGLMILFGIIDKLNKYTYSVKSSWPLTKPATLEKQFSQFDLFKKSQIKNL